MKLYELVNALRYREHLDKVPPLRISELADAMSEIDERLSTLERKLMIEHACQHGTICVPQQP